MAIRSDHRKFVVGEPSVYVIGHQALNAEGLASFLEDEGFPNWRTTAKRSSEIIPEVAGRLCYMSFAKGREHPEYIENIKREKHGSVLEHATLTFLVTGVSRSFTHECVRHRVGWSYSQLSQRYVDETIAQMVCPKIILDTEFDTRWRHIYDRWHSAVDRARESYRDLCAQLEFKLTCDSPGDHVPLTAIRKLVRGAARSVLPGATETKIVTTCNARSLRHFLEMRTSVAADGEIRRVAMKMYYAALPFLGSLLADYEVRLDESGEEYLATPFVKV